MQAWVLIAFLCTSNQCEQLAHIEVVSKARCYTLMDRTHANMRRRGVKDYLLVCTRWAEAA